MIKYVCSFEQMGKKKRKLPARKLGLSVTLRGEKKLRSKSESYRRNFSSSQEKKFKSRWFPLSNVMGQLQIMLPLLHLALPVQDGANSFGSL